MTVDGSTLVIVMTFLARELTFDPSFRTSGYQKGTRFFAVHQEALLFCLSNGFGWIAMPIVQDSKSIDDVACLETVWHLTVPL